MKVVIIRPKAPNALSFTNILNNEPLELEYIYTELTSRGHDVYIYDALVEKRKVSDVIARERPDVVSVTGYITQEKLMIEYLAQAKNINPDITTIVGGVHAQLNYKNFYFEHIDYIYRSESLIDLARLIEGEPLHSINGLVYKSDGKYIVNELMPIDINELPIPDRSFFNEHKENYKYLHMTGVATIKTAFSCPYNCNFCYCTLLAGGKYRARDIELVVEEIRGIDANYIQIVDDDFLVDKVRLRRFIELIKQYGINKTYLCYARADFTAENPDLVEELSRVGVKYFLVGLEAVSDNVLKSMNKETSLDQNRRSIENIKLAGANCIALMIATIDADDEYFENIYKFVQETGLEYVTVSVFTPIPGTPLYEEYKHKIDSHDVEHYDFLHLVLEPEKMSRRAFYMAYHKLFLRLYSIAKKSGIYDFMDVHFYMDMLTGYLKRKMKGE